MATWFANILGYSSSTTGATGAIGPQGSISSATPPANPSTGSVWVNSTTGNLNVYNGNNWTTVGAGGGGAGGYSSGTYTITPTWGNITTGSTTTINSPLVVHANGKAYDITKMLDTIMEQLCIIVPDETKMEKYPALREAYNEYRRLLIPEAAKEAYDNYKTIEALLKNSEIQDE